MNVRFSGTVTVGSFRNPKTKRYDSIGQNALKQIKRLVQEPLFRESVGERTVVKFFRMSESVFRIYMKAPAEKNRSLDYQGPLIKFTKPTSHQEWANLIADQFWLIPQKTRKLTVNGLNLKDAAYTRFNQWGQRTFGRLWLIQPQPGL